MPTLHALARGLGTEVTALLGDPPAIASNGAPDPPALVELGRSGTDCAKVDTQVSAFIR